MTDDLESRVRQLEDRVLISETVTKYAIAVDTNTSAGVRLANRDARLSRSHGAISYLSRQGSADRATPPICAGTGTGCCVQRGSRL